VISWKQEETLFWITKIQPKFVKTFSARTKSTVLIFRILKKYYSLDYISEPQKSTYFVYDLEAFSLQKIKTLLVTNDG
jgi:hypothetical protein